MKISKKANTLLYILILVNIALVMGVIVFNNSITINNNLNMGSNSEEVYQNIYNKGHMALQTVKKFNKNGGSITGGASFTDVISCPTKVTMSGSTFRGGPFSTLMRYDLGTIYCTAQYRGKELKIFFNNEKTEYDSVYYGGDLIKLRVNSGSTVSEGGNIASQAVVSGTNDYSSTYRKTYTTDNNVGTQYYSTYTKRPYLNFTFPTPVSISRIFINKIDLNYSSRCNKFGIDLYDNGNNRFQYSVSNNRRRDSTIEYNLGTSGISDKTKRIRVRCLDNRKVYFNIKEINIYELLVSNLGIFWEGVSNFSDDNTYISFTSEGTGGGDFIDDDMNTDDYRGGSTTNNFGTYINYYNYAFGFEDDDILPRKTFWGNIPTGSQNYNIFWNNYKTNEIVENNLNNSPEYGYSQKIANVSTGNLYLDTYNINNTTDSLFDMKIIQFDRQKYKDFNTLIPLKVWEGKGITNFVGYINLNSSGSLYLNYHRNGEEFPFNFKDNDYSIFITNRNIDGDISYVLKGETNTGSGIYINPIDDSGSGIVVSLSNHMLMGGEKNFIGENFKIIGPK